MAAPSDGLSGDDESSHHDVLPAGDEAAQPLRLRVKCSGERRRTTPPLTWPPSVTCAVHFVWGVKAADG